MNSWFFSSFSPYLGLFTCTVLVLVDLPVSFGSAAGSEKYNTCSKEFNCGNITGLAYPFWGSDRPLDCGHPDLRLYCHDDIPTIKIKGVEYRVLSFEKDDQTLRIARRDYSKGICSPVLLNTTLDPTLFDYARDYQYITFFYGCPSYLSPFSSKGLSCPKAGIPLHGGGYVIAGPQPQGPGLCNVSLSVPVLSISFWEEIANLSKLDQFIEGVIGEGFVVKVKIKFTACNECLESKGVCGHDLSNQTTCFCKNQPQSSKTCSSLTAAEPSHASSPPGSSTVPRKIGIGVSAAGGVVLVTLAMLCGFRRNWSSGAKFNLKKKSKDDKKVEEFLRRHGSLAPKRYTYWAIKKMTNSFTCKLGQGGFGSVYKGKLSDDRLVAVKVLSELKGNGEEFMNEIASIGRTSHVNVVMLLGFCHEGAKRALIYEFMPNGSLDKFISEADFHLECDTLYRIAVGIGRGLEYLHRGCNTRILHFDIKPHNILLDEDFCPKISDFGLAKLCQRKESLVSMTHARGTIGYIAPEVFCKNFGGVSHKSDVYSYGMLVLDLVGGRKNRGATRTSDQYFPDWIYKHLEQNGDDMILGRVLSEEEEETVRKMILVSLWCIQTNPKERPSIEKVVEMLEGSLQAIETPPKPFLFSPPSSPHQSSATSFSVPST